MHGLTHTIAGALCHEAPSASQQLSLEDDPLVLRGVAELNLVRASSETLEVVDVNRRLVAPLPRRGYSTGVFHTIDVNPEAVEAEQGPIQRKYDQTL